MARRRHKIDAKAGQVEKRGCQHVQIRLTGIAAGGRYLAQLQGTAEQLLEVLLRVLGQVREVTIGDEVIALRRAELWVSADGEGRQRRTLAPGEVLQLTARDHFILELPEPDAFEFLVDGELTTPPADLESEWFLYLR